MHRSFLLVLGPLLFCPVLFGQTIPTDSQTLQALLAEVRQLRQDLRTTSVSIQRAQILVYRVEVQEAAVARAAHQLDDSRSKLIEVKNNRKSLAEQIKVIEDSQSRRENLVEQKEIEDALPRLKARLEMLGSEEQQGQARETEAEDQLRIEQAKLSGLQDQLDQLDKVLEISGRQVSNGPAR
jgi:chromosome segregation ATPase